MLGQLISNMATALIMIPVALSAAAEVDISPRPVLMSLTVAAAASFLTPVATPANLMVMRPGGYRFGDYWKLGLPILLLFGVVSVLLVPVIWSSERGPSPGCHGALEPALVSTGTLPDAGARAASRAEAHERYRGNRSGTTSSVYPALARVSPDLFGICVVGMSGTAYAAGDCEADFTIMSVAKPFVFALACELLGPEETRQRIGVDGTGLPFDSLAAVERSNDGRTNPMVNSGAIATTSLLPGRTPRRQVAVPVRRSLPLCRPHLSLADDVYRSASETNMRNRSIAFLLRARDRIYCDPMEALDLYTRQSCLRVTATDLAVMGATLADGGVNPITGEQVIAASTCRHTLAVMTTAGLYETSGSWLYDVGLPGKSGIGGGIVTVLRARAVSEPSRRPSTPPETASGDSLRRGSYRIGSGFTCSRRSLHRTPPGRLSRRRALDDARLLLRELVVGQLAGVVQLGERAKLVGRVGVAFAARAAGSPGRSPGAPPRSRPDAGR